MSEPIHDCPTCGRKARVTDKFCVTCGEKLLDYDGSRRTVVDPQRPLSSLTPSPKPPPPRRPPEGSMYACPVCASHQPAWWAIVRCSICANEPSEQAVFSNLLPAEAVRRHSFNFPERTACVDCGGVVSLGDFTGCHRETEMRDGGGQYFHRKTEPDWAEEARLTLKPPHMQILEKAHVHRFRAMREKQSGAPATDPLTPSEDVIDMERASAAADFLLPPVTAEHLDLLTKAILLRPCPRCDTPDPLGIVQELGDAAAYFKPKRRHP